MAIKKTPIKKVAAGAAVNNKNKKKEKTKTRPKGKVKRLKTKSKPKKKKKTKTPDKEVKKKNKGDKTKSSSEKKKKEKEKMEKEKKEKERKEKLEKEKVNKPKQPEAKAPAAAKAVAQENYDVRYEKEVEKAKANAQYVGKVKEVPSKKALPPVKVTKSKVVDAQKAQQKESPAVPPAVGPAFAETSDILIAPAAPPPPPPPAPASPKEIAKEQPAEADPLDSPTKKLAPDDFCHIFNAKENVLNGVKMSPEEVKASAAVDPPKIDLALAELEAVASAEDAPKKVEEIAPADYIQIYSAKEGPAAAEGAPAPPAVPALADATSKVVPSTDVLKKAVNENVVNAGKDNEKH